MKSLAGISRTLYATTLIIGATVGIGFFGIPYTFAVAGTGVGIIFLILIAMILLTANLLYGEIILRTHRRHQFVGYVRTYLGPWARTLSLFSYWIAFYGAITATILVNSLFGSQILSLLGLKISPMILGVIFFAIAVALVYRGLRMVSRVDVIVFLGIVFITVILATTSLSRIQWDNFIFLTHKNWFIPFGVILFALNGVQGIPLARELLVGSEIKLRRAIKWGTLIPTLFYLFFALMIVGMSGSRTSPEAIIGLQSVLGTWVVWAGSLLGFMTSTTIFLSMSSSFKEALTEDFGFKKPIYFLVFVLPALIFFLSGAASFIQVIGLVGGVAGSIDMILLLLMYIRAKEHGQRVPEYSLRIPSWLLYFLLVLFFAAALYTAVVR